MKTKLPTFDGLEFSVTPDYSPRVPRVTLPSHVREQGQKLVERRVVSRGDWEVAQGFYLTEPSEKHTVVARVSEVREGKPRAVAMDDLDWEGTSDWLEEANQPNISPARTRVSSAWRHEADTTEEEAQEQNYFFDWIDPDSLQALAPKSSQDVMLQFEGKPTRGKFAPIEVDDVDLEIFD